MLDLSLIYTRESFAGIISHTVNCSITNNAKVILFFTDAVVTHSPIGTYKVRIHITFSNQNMSNFISSFFFFFLAAKIATEKQASV